MNKITLLDTKDLDNQPEELRELCKKIFSKGKGLRSRLVFLLGEHLGLSEHQKLQLSRMVEYIHNSSLLHDDFIDHSSLRRHQKTAWLEFSPSQAVLAGDYLMAQVIRYLTEQDNKPLFQLTINAIVELVQGEFLQKEACKKQIVSLEHANKICELKTASLFKWSLKACFYLRKKQAPAPVYKLLDQIGRSLGLLFQRSDDLIDFSIRNPGEKDTFLDLKRDYLNTFGTFLISKKSSDFKKEFRKIRNFSELQACLPDLDEQLQAFDEINSKMIAEVEEDIENLQPFLEKSEYPLIKQLQKLPSKLYWRK